LIALESGIATTETVFTWNGEKRTFPTWEKNMTLKNSNTMEKKKKMKPLQFVTV
jgi:beta-lactamase class D